MNKFIQAGKITLEDIKSGYEVLYKRQDNAQSVNWRLKQLGYTIDNQLSEAIKTDINNYEEFTHNLGEYILQYFPKRVVELFTTTGFHNTFVFPIVKDNNKIEIKYGKGWSNIRLLFNIDNNTLIKESSMSISIDKSDTELYQHIEEIINEINSVTITK